MILYYCYMLTYDVKLFIYLTYDLTLFYIEAHVPVRALRVLARWGFVGAIVGLF
jgi:hypothetical protein